MLAVAARRRADRLLIKRQGLVRHRRHRARGLRRRLPCLQLDADVNGLPDGAAAVRALRL